MGALRDEQVSKKLAPRDLVPMANQGHWSDLSGFYPISICGYLSADPRVKKGASALGSHLLRPRPKGGER
jgi:hypothetical protein